MNKKLLPSLAMVAFGAAVALTPVHAADNQGPTSMQAEAFRASLKKALGR